MAGRIFEALHEKAGKGKTPRHAAPKDKARGESDKSRFERRLGKKQSSVKKGK